MSNIKCVMIAFLKSKYFVMINYYIFYYKVELLKQHFSIPGLKEDVEDHQTINYGSVAIIHHETLPYIVHIFYS